MPVTAITAALNMLQPVQRPEDARQDACKFKASMTRRRPGGRHQDLHRPRRSAGAGCIGRHAELRRLLDVRLHHRFQRQGAVQRHTANWLNTGMEHRAVWIAGIFDPADVKTKATPVAEVDTFTPATVTTGDVDTLTYTAPDGTVTPSA
jgi:hypothetical protein